MKSSGLPLSKFPRAAVTNCHRLRGRKQKKFILSQFWRLGVQNQGFVWVGSLWRQQLRFRMNWWPPRRSQLLTGTSTGVSCDSSGEPVVGLGFAWDSSRANARGRRLLIKPYPYLLVLPSPHQTAKPGSENCPASSGHSWPQRGRHRSSLRGNSQHFSRLVWDAGS